MTERWQDEVKRLGDLEPSDDIWRRAEQGPQGETGPSLPPRRQRVVAGVVAFVVFLAAGGFAWRALRPPVERSVGSDLDPSIVVILRILERDGVSLPTATLRVDDRTILGGGSTTHWQSAGTVESPPDFTDGDFTPLQRGSLLGAAGDAESVDAELQQPGTFPFQSVVSFGQLSDAVKLDQPIGRYVLRLTGHWLQGNATFYFPIDLLDQAVIARPDADAAVLTFVGKNAPTATLDYGDGQQDGLRTTYTWCQDSSHCVQGTVDFTTGYPPAVDHLPIPAGTRLTIEGDATAIAGIFRPKGDSGNEPVNVDGNAIPQTPGRYVLQLDVEFDQSSATFFLGVEATSATPTSVQSVNELAGSSWSLASIDGAPVPKGARPVTLQFTADRLGGVDGCNSYGAPYRVDGTSIQVDGFQSTAMMCTGGGTMERAKALYEGLRSATSFELTTDQLTITSPTTSLTFEPAAAP
jgi:heat shock protein HslJ